MHINPQLLWRMGPGPPTHRDDLELLILLLQYNCVTKKQKIL